MFSAIPTSSKSAQRGPHDLRDLTHLVPRHARHGIEIDAQLVGMIEIVGAHGMRMQLQAGEVGHPDERGRVSRHHLLGRATRMGTAA